MPFASNVPVAGATIHPLTYLQLVKGESRGFSIHRAILFLIDGLYKHTLKSTILEA